MAREARPAEWSAAPPCLWWEWEARGRPGMREGDRLGEAGSRTKPGGDMEWERRGKHGVGGRKGRE